MKFTLVKGKHIDKKTSEVSPKVFRFALWVWNYKNNAEKRTSSFKELQKYEHKITQQLNLNTP